MKVSISRRWNVVLCQSHQAKNFSNSYREYSVTSWFLLPPRAVKYNSGLTKRLYVQFRATDPVHHPVDHCVNPFIIAWRACGCFSEKKKTFWKLDLAVSPPVAKVSSYSTERRSYSQTLLQPDATKWLTANCHISRLKEIQFPDDCTVPKIRHDRKVQKPRTSRVPGY